MSLLLLCCCDFGINIDICECIYVIVRIFVNPVCDRRACSSTWFQKVALVLLGSCGAVVLPSSIKLIR